MPYVLKPGKSGSKSGSKSVVTIVVGPESRSENRIRKSLGLPELKSNQSLIRLSRRRFLVPGPPLVFVLRPGPWSTELERLEAFRLAGAEASVQISNGEWERVQIGVGDEEGGALATTTAFTEGLLLHDYRYDRFLSARKSPKSQIWIQHPDRTSVTPALERAGALVRGTHLARDLMNAPANALGPAELEAETRKVALRHKLRFNCLGLRELEAGGYGGIVAIGQGSNREARLIEVQRKVRGARTHIALIGKGVCFDSGGLSLKPPKSMELMKKDMGGAAVLIGLLEVLGIAPLDIDVTVIIPAVENLPGPNAIRPGDVIRMLNGKSVEILNTDAEGRIILADALTHAARLKPDILMAVATLTGSAGFTFGNQVSPIFSTDDDLSRRLVLAGNETYERVWPMPLYREYHDSMTGTISDLKNVGVSGHYPAGAILAACFLNQFVDKQPWVHLDCANLSYSPSDNGYKRQGATGTGVRLLYRFLEGLTAKPYERASGTSR